MKIVALSGGLSPERNVSLTSGALIANALRERGHLVALTDLYLGGGEGFTDAPSPVPAVGEAAPDLEALIAANGGRRLPIAPGILSLCRQADRTFLALHGGIGENGRLQAVLDCEGISYTGSDSLSSAIAMNKDMTKRLLRHAGIPTADWLALRIGADGSTPQELAAVILEGLGCPCVVKPASNGSSVGVGFADSPEQLKDAVAAAVDGIGTDGVILAERRIYGREFSAGILFDRALPVIEIIPKTGFYDYKNKYVAGLTEEITPADLTPGQTARIQSLALAVHRTVGLGSYSRVDFLLDRHSGDFCCLEVNTLPGMTPTSLLPKEAAAAGIPYAALCESIAVGELRT